jgi:dTDP-4-dehydrorhamnose 3,5-epimerase
MEYQTLTLEGLLLITPDVFQDERGLFFESYNKSRYEEIGIGDDFVQDNYSRSKKNSLRGLHFQSFPGQAKLIWVTHGSILDIAVDIRAGSSTCGEWEATKLSAEDMKQLYIPAGFAHGFCVISEEAEVQYKCSSLYNPETERTIAWNDPDIGVEWPVSDPIISERDKHGMSFQEYLKKNSS